MSGVIQQIYDSEINAIICWFWDGGFDLQLGDEMNGYVATGHAETWDEVEAWLVRNIIRHFPDSDFAKNLLRGEKTK